MLRADLILYATLLLRLAAQVKALVARAVS